MQTKHVHFIDDDPTAGDLFRRFVRDKDYTLHVFKNPLQALQHIREHGSDLVITDLSMPGMSGSNYWNQYARPISNCRLL